MPIQLGRNPKSYPPNDAYRENWDRIFGKKEDKATKGSGADALAHLTRATRERYCDERQERKP